MKNPRILVGVLALSLGLSACGEAPVLSPDGPSYDGGSMFGTGHRADTTSTTTSSTSTESGERGGPTFGTGH